MAANTVTISIDRFKALELCEKLLNESFSNQFIRVSYYGGTNDYYLKTEANQSLIDRIYSLENSNKQLIKSLNKKWWNKLF